MTTTDYPILLEIDKNTFGAETPENRAFGYLDEKIAEFRGLIRRISSTMGDIAQALTIERQQIAGGYATWGDSMDTRWARLERDLERRQYVVNEINDLALIAGVDADALWEEILRRLNKGDWKIL